MNSQEGKITDVVGAGFKEEGSTWPELVDRWCSGGWKENRDFPWQRK